MPDGKKGRCQYCGGTLWQDGEAVKCIMCGRPAVRPGFADDNLDYPKPPSTGDNANRRPVK
jgi:hypothetical protein